MKEFMGYDFMLNTKTALELYRTVENAPIFDYHCHLNARDIAENKRFSNLTDAWLKEDRIKWRAMRSFGVDEYYITGDAEDYQKFLKWAEVVPCLVGNPLYHRVHLELQRFFDIYEPLSPLTANAIWEKANEVIQSPRFSVFEIFKKFNVVGVCTTDDPLSSLEYHMEISQNPNCSQMVLPSFAPEKAINIENKDFSQYVLKLSEVCQKTIISYEDLIASLEERLLFFKSLGARTALYGPEILGYIKTDRKEADEIFKKALKGTVLTDEEITKYKTAILTDLGKKYKEHNFVMIIHINNVKNASERCRLGLGVNMGFDSINDTASAYSISKLLSDMEVKRSLPKTILYTSNPEDNYMLSAMTANFTDCGIKGKVQFGIGGTCHHKEGIESHIKAVASSGVLPHFTGIVTDAQCFMAYPMHEYFRRILCNVIGDWVENGEYPNAKILSKIVSDISYKNIKEYLEI